MQKQSIVAQPGLDIKQRCQLYKLLIGCLIAKQQDIKQINI